MPVRPRKSPSSPRIAALAALVSFHAALLPAGRLLTQEPPSPPAPRLSPTMAGHAAFGAGHYDDAIRQYRLALAQGSRWDWLPGLIETVEARRRLGAIAPADTHRVGIIWVKDIYLLRSDGSRAHRPDVPEERKAGWRLELAAVRATIETLSGGRWTLAFDEVDAVATHPEDSPFKSPNPDHLDLERYFLANADRHDTYITFSTTTSPSMGLARRYPVVHGVLYGPHRGMAAVSSGSFSLVLHEFFHCIEYVSGGLGGPAHGWREPGRRSYPAWHGSTEFDYYRWHFATTLRDRDWRTMNHTNRWWLYPSAERAAAQERILAAYAAIPLATRLAARQLADSARRVQDADLARAQELYRRALAMSPYAPEALVPVYRALSAEQPGAESLAVYARRLADVRAISEFMTWDTLIAARGTLAGAWWPEQLGREGAVLEWDASEAVTGAGPHVVTLLRQGGRSTLAIEWVALVEDGREVARQTRHATLWPSRTVELYQLSLPAHRAGARYTIRARVAAPGGSDSNGLVLVRRN